MHIIIMAKFFVIKYYNIHSIDTFILLDNLKFNKPVYKLTHDVLPYCNLTIWFSLLNSFLAVTVRSPSGIWDGGSRYATAASFLLLGIIILLIYFSCGFLFSIAHLSFEVSVTSRFRALRNFLSFGGCSSSYLHFSDLDLLSFYLFFSFSSI